MVLHRGDRLGRVTEALDGSIVEIEVRDAHIPRQGLGIHRETVILGRDFNLAGAEILDRMVCAAMSELQLEGLAANRQSEDLVPQTDAEHRHAGVNELANVADGIPERGGVAGAIAEKNSVRLDGEKVRRWRRCRKYMDVAAV